MDLLIYSMSSQKKVKCSFGLIKISGPDCYNGYFFFGRGGEYNKVCIAVDRTFRVNLAFTDILTSESRLPICTAEPPPSLLIRSPILGPT